MQYSELSPALKRRIHHARCPLCGNPISPVETTEHVYFKNGRYKNYVFFHTECLRKSLDAKGGINNGEEA